MFNYQTLFIVIRLLFEFKADTIITLFIDKHSFVPRRHIMPRLGYSACFIGDTAIHASTVSHTLHLVTSTREELESTLPGAGSAGLADGRGISAFGGVTCSEVVVNSK